MAREFLGASEYLRPDEPEHKEEEARMLARAAQWARRQRGEGSFMDRAAKRPRIKSYEFCLLLDASMASGRWLGPHSDSRA